MFAFFTYPILKSLNSIENQIQIGLAAMNFRNLFAYYIFD